MDTESRYGDLLKLRQRLQDKCDVFAKKLSEAQSQLRSVTTTLELLGYGAKPLVETLENRFIFPPPQLKGLTQPQALERIAKANNGRFKIVEVIPVLVEAGILKKSKNSYSIIFGTIQRTEKYERVGPGEYGLKSEGQQRNLLVAK
jgi:hypothetical protein